MHRVMTAGPASFVLAAFLGLAGTSSMAVSPSSPIECRALPGGLQPGSEAHLDGICDALQNRPDITGRSAELRLVLIVEDLRPDHVTAYLEWQGADGRRRGPSVEFGFLDTGLGPAQYEFVAAGLTQATNLP